MKNIVQIFFFKNFLNIATFPVPAIGCTENVQPIGVTLISLARLSCFPTGRGIGCSELGENTIFPEHPEPEHPVYVSEYLFKELIQWEVKKPCVD